MFKQTIFVALIVLMSCKNSQQTPSNSQQQPNELPEVQAVIVEKLGEKFNQIERGDLSLCFTIDKKAMTNWRTFLVINHKTGAIIYGPKKLNAKISWHSDRKLLIKETPEVIKDKGSTETFKYIFNLDTQEKESSNL